MTFIQTDPLAHPLVQEFLTTWASLALPWYLAVIPAWWLANRLYRFL